MDAPVCFTSSSGSEVLLLHTALVTDAPAGEVTLLLVTSSGLINAPSCYKPIKAISALSKVVNQSLSSLVYEYELSYLYVI